jgi:hypothetical protein
MSAARKPAAIDTHRAVLEHLEIWDDYLRAQSQLPGPRANLELLEAAILVGDHTRFQHLLALDDAVPGGAPPNTPDEFLTACGVAGLGKLLAEDQGSWPPEGPQASLPESPQASLPEDQGSWPPEGPQAWPPEGSQAWLPEGQRAWPSESPQASLPESPQASLPEGPQAWPPEGPQAWRPESQRAWLAELQRRAADPRWRVREAVAIALQHWGDGDRPALITEMRSWCRGSWFVRRAVVAALAEPRLLRPTPSYDPTHDVLQVFDEITAAVAAAACRKEEGFQVLRQALGYAWSVVVGANPQVSRPAFERWLHHAETSRDKDLAWIVRQNLAKNRLAKLDPAWTTGWAARLATIRT